MATELFILLFTTIIIFVDTTESCIGLHQSLMFGIVAYFPMKYSNAINICGVFVVSINLVVRGIGESKDLSFIIYYPFNVTHDTCKKSEKLIISPHEKSGKCINCVEQ
ncbi:hypothetical protein ACTXT7_004369 [Hymenolepis weldensis]